jgi:hypothetical protein
MLGIELRGQQVVVGTEDLRIIFKISRTTHTDWNNKGFSAECQIAKGEYDLVKAVRWYKLYKDSSGQDDAGLPGIKKDTAKVNLELLKLELAEKKELLIPLQEVASAWAQRMLIFSVGMNERVDKLAPLLESKTVDEIYGILAEYDRKLMARIKETGKFCDLQGMVMKDKEKIGKYIEEFRQEVGL